MFILSKTKTIGLLSISILKLETVLCSGHSVTFSLQHAKITTSMLWGSSLLFRWGLLKQMCQRKEQPWKVCFGSGMEHINYKTRIIWTGSFQSHSRRNSSCLQGIPQRAPRAGDDLTLQTLFSSFVQDLIFVSMDG